MNPELFNLMMLGLLCLLLILLQVVRMMKMRQTTPKSLSPPQITITGSKVFIGENGMPVVLDPEENLSITPDPRAAIVVNAAERLSGHPGSEKRSSPRKRLYTTVDFIRQGRLFKEISRDFSDSGIFIKSRHPEAYRLNEDLTLAFQSSGGSPYKHHGKIVRKSRDGIGIQFVAV